ncbi:DUF2063 domain-containing protein [Ferrovibrio terrae]|uniref:DUF2063 domain-containing protein n=1 Tax=Ferrovibrio terrae TaxID=2594003 RepID=A0A516GYC7_9PROT|nr:DNA-binding domain-containing protein [Ferrovibrio terrae]QDO96497.1 DUF2063 domain-containing protein [Ferrovibrio terrae]
MQTDFAAALLDAGRRPPAGLFAADVDERFAIYRNNVVSGLSRALAAGFPATEAIVGAEFFAAMAAIYVRISPPASPVLLDYGASLPDFLARFEPAAELPYLADVARLELAYTRAFHAADTTPLPADRLGSIAAERLGAVRVTLHPSLQILRSAYPAATIWAMNTGRAPLGEIEDWTAQDVLVLRPHYDTVAIPLAPGEAEFLLQMQAGADMAEATAAALHDVPDFDLATALAALFARGAVIAFTDQDPP